MTPADCYCHAARAKFDEDDFAGALELARVGLLRDKHHPGLLQVCGVSAAHLGDGSTALAALEAASLVAPLEPLAQLVLADVYAQVGHPKTALAMLRFLAEPGRCSTPLLPDLARVLGRVGAYRTALRVCRRLIQARPWYHPAHYGAAYYLAKLKRPAARVLDHLRAAHKLAPHAVPYRVALAGALADAARPEEACELIHDVPAAAIACPSCLRRLQGAAEDAGEAELAMRLRDRLRELLTDRREEGDRDCC